MDYSESFQILFSYVEYYIYNLNSKLKAELALYYVYGNLHKNSIYI